MTAELGPEMDELRSNLQTLDHLLRERASMIHAALRPGLSIGEIRGMLEGLPLSIPPAVELLYAWHDGAEIVDGNDRAELFPNAQMVPLAEVLRKRSEVEELSHGEEAPLWNSYWLPVFIGYKSVFWVVDCAPDAGHVLAFDWVDLPEVWVAYDGVGSMVERIVRCWGEGAYGQGGAASVKEDARKVAAINREFDRAAPDMSHLIADLTSGDDHLYVQARRQLLTRLYPEAVPYLIDLLETQRKGRRAAVELLGAIGGPDAMACLRRVADSDPDERLRAFALRTVKESSSR